MPDSYAYVNKLRERFTGIQMRDVSTSFGRLRLIKTDYEQKMLAESARISAEAHREGMKTARPNVWEYQVQAAMEYVFKKDGAIGWGYPSIVASGPNATTLHYEASTRQMKDGDLLLVDAAANYDYLTTDITRTYPINGKFTPAQKDIYEIVLRAQDEGIKVAVKGATLGEINAKTVEVIKDGLFKLGLITETKGQQYSIWYTHSSSHWIGIDVHDVGERNARLADGMAFTIEPGIYIRQEALDNLAKTPENQAFIQKVQSTVDKYKNIGVRIEDSFIMNDGRAKSISVGIPRTVDEIEAFMKPRLRERFPLPKGEGAAPAGRVRGEENSSNFPFAPLTRPFGPPSPFGRGIRAKTICTEECPNFTPNSPPGFTCCPHRRTTPKKRNSHGRHWWTPAPLRSEPFWNSARAAETTRFT